MINLFLIDKQTSYIYGLKTIFEEADNNIQFVGSASSCKKAIEYFENNIVHILLIDPSINDSLNNTCIEKIKRTFPEMKIIVLTNELDINYLNNLWLAGIDGVELKNCGKKALLNVITFVMEGKRVVGKEIPDFTNKSDTFRCNEVPKLSLKEMEIYQLMLTVKSCEEIARKLKLPIVAVKFHCKNILKKVSKIKNTTTVKDIRNNLLVS